MIKPLKPAYENTLRQHPDVNSVTEHACRVLTATAYLARCTPASVSKSAKWTLIAQNMDTRRNLLQLLKEKQLYSTLRGAYVELLHDLMAVLKESTAKTTITAPPSIKEYHEQRM
jgi:hypothetical protein